jgi:hypothetical protein
MYLYGVNDEKAKQNFRRLKSRLSRRIFNTLYFLDMNLYSIKEQYERIAYEQRRLVSAINILKRNGAREAAIKIIKDNYQTAEKFYLYDVLKYYDFELCIYYSLNDDSQSFKKYNTKYHLHAQNEALVQEATLLYYDSQLEMHYKKGVTSSSELSKESILKNFIDKMKSIRDKVYSYETEYYYLRSLLTLHEYKLDSVSIIKISDEIIALTTQNNFRQDVWHGVAVIYKSKALLSIGSYEEGLSILKKNLMLFNEGGINWFIALEYTFLIALRIKDLKLADTTYETASKHRSFKSKSESLVQKWYIFKAYLILVSEEQNHPVVKSHLKIARLYNDTPFYVNDKSGYFLAIRLLEMTELIRQNDYDAFSEKCGLLRRYRQQYMEKETHHREFVFTDMLLSLEKLQFSQKEAESVLREKYEYLLKNEKKLLINDFEIVPYHYLWEVILRYLSQH